MKFEKQIKFMCSCYIVSCMFAFLVSAFFCLFAQYSNIVCNLNKCCVYSMCSSACMSGLMFYEV